MKNRRLQNGFSLTEVLMAAGILAVGLLLIAGTFPAGIFLTAAAVEQTIAPIAADEAFAKIRLYSVNWSGFTSTMACFDFNDINAIKNATDNINGDEYLYPSDNVIEGRVYSWSAICRRVYTDQSLVQVTVFVSRKMGGGLQYYWQDSGGNIYADSFWPSPVKVTIAVASGNTLAMSNPNHWKFITDGCTLISDMNGDIYRVLERDMNIIVLDRDWVGSMSDVWIVPPPVSGGRSPVVGVYQRIIKF